MQPPGGIAPIKVITPRLPLSRSCFKEGLRAARQRGLANQIVVSAGVIPHIGARVSSAQARSTRSSGGSVIRVRLGDEGVEAGEQPAMPVGDALAYNRSPQSSRESLSKIFNTPQPA
jgi:hypothetical protein